MRWRGSHPANPLSFSGGCWRKPSPGLKTNKERKEKQTLWAKWKSCLVTFAHSGVTWSFENDHICWGFYGRRFFKGHWGSKGSRYKGLENVLKIRDVQQIALRFLYLSFFRKGRLWRRVTHFAQQQSHLHLQGIMIKLHYVFNYCKW